MKVNFSVAVTLRVMVKLKGILMLEWLNTLGFEGDLKAITILLVQRNLIWHRSRTFVFSILAIRDNDFKVTLIKNHLINRDYIG